MNHLHSMTAGATALVIAASLGGCASGPRYQTSSIGEPAYGTPSYSYDYGVVDSIQLVRGGDTRGTGAIAGGVVGGLLGNQIGGGSGRTAATIAGAVGGAVVGNEIERQNSASDQFQVGVRLDRGGYPTVTQDSPSDLRIGDRVRVENGRAFRF